MGGVFRGIPRGGFMGTLAGLCLLWSHAAIVPAHAVELHEEAAVKAAYVMRFAGHVEWPAPKMQADQIRVAVLGDSALAQQLESQARGRILGGRQVVVTRVTTATAARDAHVLVVGTARRASLRGLVRALDGEPVLVVAAEDHALRGGAMINFVKDADRLRFEISRASAQAAGLRISSELLSVAVRVQQ